MPQAAFAMIEPTNQSPRTQENQPFLKTMDEFLK
jgi:hypothetical protein